MSRDEDVVETLKSEFLVIHKILHVPEKSAQETHKKNILNFNEKLNNSQ